MHRTATNMQTYFVPPGIVLVRLRSAGRETIGYALLDNESDMNLISSNTQSRCGKSQKTEPFTIKMEGRTMRSSSVSSVFQALPIDESESVNIESAKVAGELPLTKSVKAEPERMRNWPLWATIPTKEIARKVLILIGCDGPGAHLVLEQRMGAERASMSCALCWNM